MLHLLRALARMLDGGCLHGGERRLKGRLHPAECLLATPGGERVAYHDLVRQQRLLLLRLRLRLLLRLHLVVVATPLVVSTARGLGAGGTCGIQAACHCDSVGYGEKLVWATASRCGSAFIAGRLSGKRRRKQSRWAGTDGVMGETRRVGV